MRLVAVMACLVAFMVAVPLAFVANGTLTFDQAQDVMLSTATPVIGLFAIVIGYTIARH